MSEPSSTRLTSPAQGIMVVVDNRYRPKKNLPKFSIVADGILYPVDPISFRVVGYSERFEDMVRSAEKVDDSAQVHVIYRGDEWKEFLDFIHGKHEHLFSASSLRYAQLNALAKISHNYDFEALATRSLVMIKKVLTTNYAVFRSLTITDDGISCPAVTMSYADGVRAVNLARALKDDSLLPIALYMAAQLDAKDLHNGYQFGDNQFEKMMVEDISRAKRGHGSLMYRAGKAIRIIGNSGVSGHCQTKTCADRWTQSTKEINWETGNYFLLLARIDKVIITKDNNFCGDCVRYLQGRVEIQRRKLWDKIPTVMGVPEILRRGWDTIE